MVLDLVSLLLLVYFTGGIESPLYMLLVFLVIIGSLILPGVVVYTMSGIFILLFALSSIFEHYRMIPHHPIEGLLGFSLYDNSYYVTAYLFTFTFVIFVSVYLANGIARQLYKREKDLVDSLNKINAAEKEKQQYIMGIVHEIKTPIAAVASYLDLILQKFLGPIDETVEEKLVRAKRRADEGIQMINDVLNVSKLTLYDKFDEDEINLSDLICGVIKRIKPTADSHLIGINFIDERKEQTKIAGDKFLLDIAISNLIGNSIKYGIDGGKVEIVLSSDGDNHVIEVCDDGVGIPENEIPKIFNDFYRGSNVKKITMEGSGLGLSVVKKIVKRHSGLITVESPSKLGKKDHPGSCFTIKLPVAGKSKTN
jgi:signal transduction histidine kinase